LEAGIIPHNTLALSTRALASTHAVFKAKRLVRVVDLSFPKAASPNAAFITRIGRQICVAKAFKFAASVHRDGSVVLSVDHFRAVLDALRGAHPAGTTFHVVFGDYWAPTVGYLRHVLQALGPQLGTLVVGQQRMMRQNDVLWRPPAAGISSLSQLVKLRVDVFDEVEEPSFDCSLLSGSTRLEKLWIILMRPYSTVAYHQPSVELVNLISLKPLPLKDLVLCNVIADDGVFDEVLRIRLPTLERMWVTGMDQAAIRAINTTPAPNLKHLCLGAVQTPGEPNSWGMQDLKCPVKHLGIVFPPSACVNPWIPAPAGVETVRTYMPWPWGENMRLLSTIKEGDRTVEVEQGPMEVDWRLDEERPGRTGGDIDICFTCSHCTRR
jgi:hypothetical protein